MNRISTLKQRTAANKHGSNASLHHTPRCSDLEHGRYTDHDCPIDASIASDSHESSEKNPARSQSSSSVPANQSNCASTVDSNGSTNHSSIFSKSDDSCHAAGDDDTRDMLVRDGYVPSKKTLGLELVASPSLLRQVLAPPSSESVSNLQSGGSSSTGGPMLNLSNCAVTVDFGGSTKNSSTSSTSDDSFLAAGNGSGRDMFVRDGYVPNKTTLGLELVASPSLVRRVIVPRSCNNVSSFHSEGYSSIGARRLGFDSLSGRDTTRPNESNLDRDTQRSVVEDRGWEEQDEDGNAEEDNDCTDVFDNEKSEHTVTQTVAATVVSTNTYADTVDEGTDDIFDDDDSEYTAMQMVAGTVYSTKTKTNVSASDSLPLQDDNTEDIEIGVVLMESSFSMRSAQSFEGSEVNLRTAYDQDDDEGEKNSSVGLPFDKGNAKIVAMSKVAAIMAPRSYQPPSCLTSSTFTGQRKYLPSPAIVQNRRVGRAARIAKIYKTFDKRHLDDEKKGLITKNAKHKRRSEGSILMCLSAPLVSFAENLDETHSMDVVRNDDTNKNRVDETLGHHSPTGVQEFFSVNDDVNTSCPDKNQEDNFIDAGDSGTTSSRDDRLTRIREAMKSIALAMGSAKYANSKKSTKGDENCVVDAMIKVVVATPAEEVMPPPILPSTSEMDIPQFCLSLNAKTSKDEKTAEPMHSADGHGSSESKHEDQNQDEPLENLSIELETSLLVEMNNSLDSTSLKKKPFLSRLRLKSKTTSATAVSKQHNTVDTNNGTSGRKRSIRSKFRSNCSSKNSGGSKKEDAKSEKAQVLDVKDVDKSTEFLPSSQQAASAIMPIEETSTKSDCTKASKFHSIMLLRNRCKNQLDHTSIIDEEEMLSGCNHFVASIRKCYPHTLRNESRCISLNAVEDDCVSIDEDSKDYSSGEYSSDNQDEVGASMTTSLQKGCTGIVDMMETAFAFGTTDETADYESESSESKEDDDDSYVQ